MASKVDFTAKLHELVKRDERQMTRWVRVDGRLCHILYIQDGELSPLGDQTEKIKKLASLIITAHGKNFKYIDKQGAHLADKIKSHEIPLPENTLITTEDATAQDAWNLLEEIATLVSKEEVVEWVEDEDGLVIQPPKETNPADQIEIEDSVRSSSPVSGLNTPLSPGNVTPLSRAAPTSTKVVPFPGKNERFLSLIELTKNAKTWDKSQDSSTTCKSILAKLEDNEYTKLEDNKYLFTELEKSKLKERIGSLMSYRDFQPDFIPVYILKDLLKHQIH